MATVALELAWVDRTGTFLFIAWEMTAGNWLGAPALTGVPTLTVNGGAGPAATAHGVAKKGTSRWIARYSLASAIAAGATVTVSASAGSCANGSITSSPALSGAAVTNGSTGVTSPADVYVDCRGEVGGLGTEAAPFCSAHEAKVYLASGVRIHARGGDQHEWDGTNGFFFNATGVTGVQLLQWSGGPLFRLIGACPLLGFDGSTTAAWRVDGMDVEPELIGYGVGSRFVTRTATDPRTGLTETFNHPSYGMEEALGANEAAQIAACQANTTGIGLWAYDSTNDRLWIHSTQGNGDPVADALDYFVLVQSPNNVAKTGSPNESNGISITNADGWVCEWETAHWMERSTGYGVFFQTSVRCVIRNSHHSCLGRHGIGFAGNDCYSNQIHGDVTVDTAGTATDSAIIFYSGTTNTYGCVADGLTVHACTLLRWDATDVALNPVRIGGAAAYTNPGAAPGLAAHSSSGATSIDANGVIYRRCRVFSWTDALSTPSPCFVFTGTHDTPISLSEPSLYAVLCEDCTFVGPVWGSCSDGGVTAFDRCFFQGTMGTTNGVAGTTNDFARALNSEVLLRSCVFSGTGESGTVASALWRVQNNDGADRAHLTTLYSSYYQSGTDVATFSLYRDGTGTDVFGRVTAYGNVFRMATDGSSSSRLIAGTTVTGAGGIRDRIDFEGNLYDVLIPDNNFGFPDSTINTQAEFASVEDQTGVYDVDLSAAFESDVTLKPSATSVLRTTLTTAAAYRGLDGPSRHRYGAWQLAARSRGRGRGRSRQNLGAV